nr:hypothetical protein [uncultured Steroidobacter sp.]
MQWHHAPDWGTMPPSFRCSNGILDVLVSGIPSSDPLIVYGNPQRLAPPLGLTTVTSPVQQFLNDVHYWTLSPARIEEVARPAGMRFSSSHCSAS